MADKSAYQTSEAKRLAFDSTCAKCHGFDADSRLTEDLRHFHLLGVISGQEFATLSLVCAMRFRPEAYIFETALL
jgi:hypothetical protein